MTANKRFHNHVALVTGAGRGIGQGIAYRFAEEGAKVALVERDQESGTRTAEEIRSRGGVGEFIPADVSKEAEVTRAITRAQQAFGGLDHLVNNAATVLVKPIQETTVEEWDQLMDINLKSVFLMMKHAFPLLRRSEYPTVVNIGSISSFVGQKDAPVYVASKGAVMMLSKTVALDFAQYHIRVNCICPGITDTPLFRYHVSKSSDPEHTVRERTNRVPLGRLLTPLDIANGVLFLSGADSGAVTGTELLVDGGYLAAGEWSNV